MCTASTGHTEAVQVLYDPKVVSYTRLCKILFGRIDPTLPERVGNDVGPQYRHGVYTHSKEQAKQAKEYFDSMAQLLPPSRPIVTELKPATIFWPAESYHQQYLKKGGRLGSPQSAEKGNTETIRCYG